MDEGLDAYATLEVPPTATSREIQAAYRRLVVNWHPDPNRGSMQAERRTKKLNVWQRSSWWTCVAIWQVSSSLSRHPNPGAWDRKDVPKYCRQVDVALDIPWSGTAIATVGTTK